MRKEILDYLSRITEEEQAILDGRRQVQKNLYGEETEFVVDSRKFLEEGRLITIRPHTRFAYFPSHRHNYIEMLYVVQGQITTILNGRDRLCMRAGDLLFLNQHARHEILPAGRDDIAVNFIILPEFFRYPIGMMDRENLLMDFLIRSLSEESLSDNFLYLQTGDILPVGNLLESMIWTLVDHTAGTGTVLQVSMGLIFLYLSRYADLINQSGPASDEQRLLLYTLDYIEHHYQDASMAEVVDSTGFPAYTISRLLKKNTGCNFKELLQKRKLQQAAYLLEHSTLPIELILMQIGYENSSYFFRKFREQYGCTPRAYRKQKSPLS